MNLSIPEGKTLGVVGESGCGKSTLGRVVMGLLPATSGEIHVRRPGYRKVLQARSFKEVRKKVQMIFQDPYSSLDPRMSICGAYRRAADRSNHVLRQQGGDDWTGCSS